MMQRALLLAGFLLAGPLLLAAPARAADPECDTPATFTSLNAPLPHVAAKLAAGEMITVVALGSSSTAGAGASMPSNAYPSRLERLLPRYLPGLKLRVLNKGQNGEEIPQMLARFERDVAAEKPDLVLWQFGTNAILRNNGVSAFAQPMQDGIDRLKATGADVVLIDLQYAPMVLADPDHPAMQAMIAEAAQANRAGLFRRFAIMQHWVTSGQLNLAQQIGPDGLHHNDFGYHCLAKSLAKGLADATRQSLHRISKE